MDCWGRSTAIDLYECEPELIRSKECIAKYIIELCELIKMKRYGSPVIVRFGQDKRVAGFSVVQLIETSSITGHFVDSTNFASIDIFSCKLYNSGVAAKFTKTYFGAKRHDFTYIRRGDKLTEA